LTETEAASSPLIVLMIDGLATMRLAGHDIGNQSFNWIAFIPLGCMSIAASVLVGQPPRSRCPERAIQLRVGVWTIALAVFPPRGRGCYFFGAER